MSIQVFDMVYYNPVDLDFDLVQCVLPEIRLHQMRVQILILPEKNVGPEPLVVLFQVVPVAIVLVLANTLFVLA